MKNFLLTIFVILFAAQVFAQSVTISGTIKNQKGLTIAGATIQEKGISNSTMSDADGNFSIQLYSRNNKLVISMSGYKTQEVAVNDTTSNIGIVVLKRKYKRVEFGILAGINYSEDGHHNEEYNLKPQGAIGYIGGIYMDLNLGKKFAFETGLHYRLHSLKEENAKYKAKADFHFVSIPLYLKHTISIKDDRLYLFYGADLNLCFKRQLTEKYDDKTHTMGDLFSMILTAPGVIPMPGIGYERQRKFGIRFNMYMCATSEVENLGGYDIVLTYKF